MAESQVVETQVDTENPSVEVIDLEPLKETAEEAQAADAPAENSPRECEAPAGALAPLPCKCAGAHHVWRS